MNSIQLISKINSRIEDLAMLSNEVLKPNSELSNIEKEVIKRSCSDLYEFILKLKTSNDISDEHQVSKKNLSEEIRKEINFKEVITNSVHNDASINTIAESKIEEVEKQEAPLETKPIEPIKEEALENVFQIGDILAEISEEFHTPNLLEKEIEPVDLAKIETTPQNNIIEVPIVNEEVIETPVVNEVIENVIIPKVFENPTVETKTINEEPKENTAPFFNIGKTIMPKTEPTLNEKIAQKLDGFQLSDKIIEPKIDNLKTAISLNKKIAFVNELFKENVVEYAKSIDKLNNANDLNEAMHIWTEMKINHNWNHEAALVKDLEKLIQRRFS